jgi:hypothetical protein
MNLSNEEIAELIYHMQFINNEYKNWKTLSLETILSWVNGTGYACDYEHRCAYPHVMGIAKIFQTKRERPFGVEPSLGVKLNVPEPECNSEGTSSADRYGQ